jgi:hypothetical protein
MVLKVVAAFPTLRIVSKISYSFLSKISSTALHQTMMNLEDRVGLLDRSTMNNQFIDPEELHYSQPDDEFTDNEVTSSTSSLQGSQDLDLSLPSELNYLGNLDSSHGSGAKLSAPDEHIDTRPGKAYAPRASAASRKSAKAALRVRPRNGQHARELERNRQAAANYRSRQRNQLDTLLNRVREEEDKMVKQKSMVYSLKEELWHLRNNLMARQQMQIFGMRNMEAAATALPQQSFNFDPVSATAQQA